MSLIDSIRKARETRVQAGKHVFVIRRPTDLEMIELRGEGSARRFLRFIVGWDNVCELDLISGGRPEPVAFDPQICEAWLEDRLDLYGPVLDAIRNSYADHAIRLEGAAKN